MRRLIRADITSVWSAPLVKQVGEIGGAGPERRVRGGKLLDRRVEPVTSGPDSPVTGHGTILTAQKVAGGHGGRWDQWRRFIEDGHALPAEPQRGVCSVDRLAVVGEPSGSVSHPPVRIPLRINDHVSLEFEQQFGVLSRSLSLPLHHPATAGNVHQCGHQNEFANPAPPSDWGDESSRGIRHQNGVRR
jgi:hypothetical protein